MRRDRLLFGRDRELEQLSRVLAEAEAGRGGLLLLAGEAGVGKTVLAEAAIGVSGMAAVRGIAAQGGGAPYGPLAGVLRDRLRRDAHAFDGLGLLRPHLGALLPELGPASEGSDRETLVEAIRRAVEMIGRADATVVLLDDLQWADAATLELLPSLAARAEEWPLLVVAAYRSDEIPRGHPLRRLRTELRRTGRLSELMVGPLDASATGALAAEVLGGQPGPVLRAALCDRTLGVPFFVEEVAAALKAGRSLVWGRRGVELEPSARVPLPETVRDAVRLRADALSGAARRALEAAAAAGTRFEFGLLSEMGEEAGLGEALEQGLVAEAEPGVGLFRHDLVREALYADTPWPRRRGLHRRLAELLEARAAEPGRVAGHWIAAAEGQRARPLLVEAARRYCAVHAYADAAAAARKALELWPEGEDEPWRVAVLDELGRCAELCGEPGEAARAWEEVAAALDRAADPRRFADTKRRLAAVYQLQGGLSEAAAARGEAAETLAACGLVSEAAREQLLAADLVSDEDPEAALAQATRVLGIARGAVDTELEARALTLEGFAFFQLGRPAEGTSAARAALSAGLAGEHVEAVVDAYWVLATIVSHYWADYTAAIDAFTEAAGLCRAHDMRQEEHLCLTCLAMNLYSRGEWQRAEALARDQLDRPPAAGEGSATAHALVTLGLVSAVRGATGRARSLFGRAARLADEAGLQGTALSARLGLSIAAELDGNGGSHWQELTQAVPGGVSLFYAHGLRLASTFAARRGEGTLVRACADALASYAARFGATDALAALAHALGEAALLDGDPERAGTQFEQALELLREVDAPFDRAHVQSRAGVALAAAGDRQAGTAGLAGAYRTFRKLGARPFWLQAAADLATLGEPVDRRLGARAARELGRGGLTRRELEILRLVAVGRTNPEIARELFLSPRTVEMHVRHMLAKLGCRSRTQAAGRAHELGLLETSAQP